MELVRKKNRTNVENIIGSPGLNLKVSVFGLLYNAIRRFMNISTINFVHIFIVPSNVTHVSFFSFKIVRQNLKAENDKNILPLGNFQN